jgi:hypothetical protein
MYRRHGSEYLVKYLKACNLALSRFVAGDPVKTLRELEPDLPLPRLTRSGLPVIIGTRDRRSIAAKSHKVIRLYLNLFSLYRIISIPGTLKTSTITDPFSGDKDFTEFVGQWAKNNFLELTGRFRQNISFKKLQKFELLETSSPSQSKSWTGMVTDILLLKRNETLLSALFKVMEVTCDQKLIDLFNSIKDKISSDDPFSYKRLYLDANEFLDSKPKDGLGLRQLSKKFEASGKVRVFAMVDS